MHNGRYRRGLLRPHPGRDPHRHLSPPARRLPPGFTGDEAGLGVSTGGKYWKKGRKVVILRRSFLGIEYYIIGDRKSL